MTDNSTRKVRTAKEKAQDALDAVDRKVKGLTARLERAKKEHESVSGQLEAAQSERTFLASHPALNQPQDTLPVGGEENA
jgi:uncharacterized protein YhaN